MIDQLIVHAIYRAFCIAAGLAFAYMGYRLFLSRIFAEAGDLDTSWGDNRLMLKRAAPGTFFALFGAAIVLVTVSRGLTSISYEEQPVQDTSSSPADKFDSTGKARTDHDSAAVNSGRKDVGPVFGSGGS